MWHTLILYRCQEAFMINQIKFDQTRLPREVLVNTPYELNNVCNTQLQQDNIMLRLSLTDFAYKYRI